MSHPSQLSMPVASEVAQKDERSPPTAPVDLAAVCPHAMKFKDTENKGRNVETVLFNVH